MVHILAGSKSVHLVAKEWKNPTGGSVKKDEDVVDEDDKTLSDCNIRKEIVHVVNTIEAEIPRVITKTDTELSENGCMSRKRMAISLAAKRSKRTTTRSRNSEFGR